MLPINKAPLLPRLLPEPAHTPLKRRPSKWPSGPPTLKSNNFLASFRCSRDSAIIDDIAANLTDSAYALQSLRPN